MNRKFRSPFACRVFSQKIEEKQEPEYQEEEEEDEPMPIIYKTKKKSKYLPGQRLQKKLNKMRKLEEEKKQLSKYDIHNLEKSMKGLLNDFN